jgi:hypothetical protein
MHTLLPKETCRKKKAPHKAGRKHPEANQDAGGGMQVRTRDPPREKIRDKIDK